MAEKNKGGRPKKYTEVEVLQKKIDAYFKECDEKEKPYTICALAHACNMSRQDLLNYSKDAKFFDTIKKAKQKCEAYAEEQLFLGKNTAGIIFNMKNNYGWCDKQEIDTTIKTYSLFEAEVEKKANELNQRTKKKN